MEEAAWKSEEARPVELPQGFQQLPDEMIALVCAALHNNTYHMLTLPLVSKAFQRACSTRRLKAVRLGSRLELVAEMLDGAQATLDDWALGHVRPECPLRVTRPLLHHAASGARRGARCCRPRSCCSSPARHATRQPRSLPLPCCPRPTQRCVRSRRTARPTPASLRLRRPWLRSYSCRTWRRARPVRISARRS